MKYIALCLVVCVVLTGCTSPIAKRTIDDLPETLAADDAIITGRLKAGIPPPVMLPSFSIADESGKEVFVCNNEPRAAKEELVFWFALPAGTYSLHRIWWGNSSVVKNWNGPSIFKVDAGRVNYIGDIEINYTQRSTHLGGGTFSMSVTAENEAPSFIDAQKPRIDEIGRPVVTRMVHE